MNFDNFIGPAYTSQSPNADLERCVNLYPEIMEAAGAKSRMALYPTPGVSLFGAASSLAPGRGLFAQDGRAFAVIGFGFYEIDSAGVKTLRGSVDKDANPATICSSGDAGGQVFVTSGDKGYIFDLNTAVFSTVIASGCTQGAYLDGYFLALDTTTSTLKASNLLDGLTWNGLRVAQRTAGADKWKGMAVVHRDIWLWGSQTTEVWYNAGLSPMPFVSNQNAVLEQGIGAAFSWARVDSGPIWFTANEQGNGQIVHATGYGTPTRISTHAIETAIAGYSTTSDAEGFSYQDQGHAFYVLTFPAAGHTWVYDATTGLWHERMYWNTASATEEAWRPLWHAYAFGKHLTLDRSSGAVYQLSTSTYTDADGASIRRIRRCPHVLGELKRILYHRLQIDLQVGIGLVSGQGSDPMLMLRFSDDGGMTWSNERTVSAGKIGKYKTRAMWNRLGSARDRVFEVAMSDPVPWRLSGAYLEVTAAGV